MVNHSTASGNAKDNLEGGGRGEIMELPKKHLEEASHLVK
jgi:hypothetical protein